MYYACMTHGFMDGVDGWRNGGMHVCMKLHMYIFTLFIYLYIYIYTYIYIYIFACYKDPGTPKGHAPHTTQEI